LLSRLRWLPLNLLQLAAIVVWTTFWVVAAMLVLVVSRRPDLPLRMARAIWAPAILELLFIRLDYSAEQPIDATQRHFYLANHQSALDIPLLFRCLPAPLRFVAKAELFRLPVLGWYMRATGMLPVDRARLSRSVRDWARGEAWPSSGSLIAFPEGTRSHGAPMRKFQRGPIAVAIQMGIPIVPVAIEGSGRCLHRSGVSCLPGRVLVRAGRPIATVDFTQERRGELTDRVEAAVRRLHAELVDQLRK
jgi:1-acyl-sn-glycerol-3-phosphate acyltransferase